MAAAASVAAIPDPTPSNLMNDHHFSYPIVVQLCGTTISGHAAQPPAPLSPPQAARVLQPTVRPAAAVAPRPKVASVAA